MKTLVIICAAAIMMLAVGSASATLSWSTAPVLGTAATPQENGDVIVQTDSGDICVPAYQHEPYGDGISMNVFETDPETGLAAVAHGSSVNIDVSLGYTIYGLWYLNDVLQIDGIYEAFPNTDVSAPDYELFSGTESLGIGNWKYTETWTSTDDNLDPITSTINFTVVPEPATMCLLGLGGLLFARKKK